MGKFEDLNKLKTLKDSGSITENEFNREKEKILNSNIDNKGNGICVASFILGVCTLIVSWLPVIGVILGIISIIIYIVARKKMKGCKETKLTVGIVCAIIGLIISVIINLSTFNILKSNENASVITNNTNNIQNIAITCAKDNRILKLFNKVNEEIQNIKYIDDNGTIIVLVQTKTIGTSNTTIYAYKNKNYYGSDLSANASTSGRTSEEIDSINRGKEIKQLWNKGITLNTNEILNKLK